MKGRFYVDIPEAPNWRGVLKAKIKYKGEGWMFSRTAEVHKFNVGDYGSVEEALADMKSKLPERAAVAQDGLQSMPNYRSADDYGALFEEAYHKGAGLPLPYEAANSRESFVSRLKDEDRLQVRLMDMENRNFSRTYLDELCGGVDHVGNDAETGDVLFQPRGWTDPFATYIMPLPVREARWDDLKRMSA